MDIKLVSNIPYDFKGRSKAAVVDSEAQRGGAGTMSGCERTVPNNTLADPGHTMEDLPPDADLATILEAWHRATIRLEQTHEILQAEVRRLTAELERKNRELARKDRLADLGRMATHIAHEVRNCLVPVALYMSLLKRQVESAEASEIIEKIEQSIRSAESVLNDILHFAADREPHETWFSLNDLLDQIIDGLKIQLAAQKVKIERDIPTGIFVWADRDLFHRAVMNLILNGLDAMPTGGILRVEAHHQEGDLVLRIADTGPGLSPEALQRAFEPFFTTKPNGTGLGLAIVERIVEIHGGVISVENGPEGGAIFTVTLPRRSVIAGESARQAA